MDQHVKHMMRSVDSLKGQTEYNMDTVTVNLFAKLKSALLYTRKKYIPRVSFQTCVVMRGTFWRWMTQDLCCGGLRINALMSSMLLVQQTSEK
eukprot:4947462-Amphidinium_carterae.1